MTKTYSCNIAWLQNDVSRGPVSKGSPEACFRNLGETLLCALVVRDYCGNLLFVLVDETDKHPFGVKDQLSKVGNSIEIHIRSCVEYIEPAIQDARKSQR
jgi:hypothetical protein